MLKLTVEGKTAEELLSALIAAAKAMSAGAGLDLVSEKPQTAAEDKKPDAAEEPAADPKPTGRRGGRNKAEDTAEQSEAAEAPAAKGRRSRGAAKVDDLVNDNEEQAALRAQLMVDLQDLADVEDAHKEVAEALKRVGAKSLSEVASASLGDFDADIQPLIAKYFD